MRGEVADKSTVREILLQIAKPSHPKAQLNTTECFQKRCGFVVVAYKSITSYFYDMDLYS